MDEIGTQLDTITGLRVFDYPPDRIEPPAAIVDYPERIEFDTAGARGSDNMELHVLVYAGRVSDRASRDQLSDYADGSGAASIKAVIEAGTYTAFDTVRVQHVEFDYAAIAGTTYVQAEFFLDIAGAGA
jgi:hypothetical protein